MNRSRLRFTDTHVILAHSAKRQTLVLPSSSLCSVGKNKWRDTTIENSSYMHLIIWHSNGNYWGEKMYFDAGLEWCPDKFLRYYMYTYINQDRFELKVRDLIYCWHNLAHVTATDILIDCRCKERVTRSSLGQWHALKNANLPKISSMSNVSWH